MLQVMTAVFLCLLLIVLIDDRLRFVCVVVFTNPYGSTSCEDTAIGRPSGLVDCL
jgi:hypothetical protein